MGAAFESFAIPYERGVALDRWELSDEPMPESVSHYAACELLRQILVAWVERTGRDALVARNLAVRWLEERPRIGADPDVCVLAPSPPERQRLRSVRTWRAGHAPPVLAIEVVSTANPKKDYSTAPEKFAANGTGELWVFDPERLGRSHGGPFVLQRWNREPDGTFVRGYAGDGPMYSPAVDAWAIAEPGGGLRIADDAAGNGRWLTAEEAAIAERDAASAERNAASAERDAAHARIAELERELRLRDR